MPTQVGQNSAISNKVFNAALFLEAVRRRSFTNMLTLAYTTTLKAMLKKSW